MEGNINTINTPFMGTNVMELNPQCIPAVARNTLEACGTDSSVRECSGSRGLQLFCAKTTRVYGCAAEQLFRLSDALLSLLA